MITSRDFPLQILLAINIILVPLNNIQTISSFLRTFKLTRVEKLSFLSSSQMGKRKIGKHNEFFDSITFTEEERKILYSPVDPNAINVKYQAALKDRKIMQDAEDFVEGLMLLMPEEYREDDGGEDSDKEGDEEKTARYLEKKYQPKGERKKDCEDQVEEVNFGAVEETGEQAADFTAK